MFLSKSKQFGRSMIEMLGVLAIVGILSAGGIAGYSMAMQSHKTNALIEKVQLISQRTRELYSDGDYSGLGTTNGASKLIQAGMVNDVNNPFGGTLTVRSTRDSNANRFVIEAQQRNIPIDSCVKVLTTYYGDAATFSGIRIYRNGAFVISFWTTPQGWTDGVYPPTTEQAINACKDGDSVLVWVFY